MSIVTVPSPPFEPGPDIPTPTVPNPGQPEPPARPSEPPHEPEPLPDPSAAGFGDVLTGNAAAPDERSPL